GPGRGRSTSSTWKSCGAWKTLARIVSTAIMAALLSRQSARAPHSTFARHGSSAGPYCEDGHGPTGPTEAKVTRSGAGSPDRPADGVQRRFLPVRPALQAAWRRGRGASALTLTPSEVLNRG